MTLADSLSKFQASLRDVAARRSDLGRVGFVIDDAAIIHLLREMTEQSVDAPLVRQEAENGLFTPDDAVLGEHLQAQKTWYERILVALGSKQQSQRTIEIAEILCGNWEKARELGVERVRGRAYAELARIHNRQVEEAKDGGPEPDTRVRKHRWSLTDQGRKALKESHA